MLSFSFFSLIYALISLNDQLGLLLLKQLERVDDGKLQDYEMQ